MDQNAVPTIFRTQNIRHQTWKIVSTSLQFIVVLQLKKGHEKQKKK